MTTTPTTPSAGLPSTQPEEVIMSWLDHARELRNRLIKASLAVVAGLIIGFIIIQFDNFVLINEIIQHFIPPGAHLQAIAVGEKFTNAMQIAFGIGLIFAMPVIVYQLLAFIVPGLTDRERKIIYFVLPLITGCFILGLFFGWFVTIPIAVSFLLDYGPRSIQASPTFEQFAGFLVHLLLLNGIVFELPVLVYAVVWLGVVQRSTLTKYRRYAVLAMSIFAAVITPTTDLASYATAAIPLYLLYEAGLFFARFAPNRKKT
ncbi:MAG: twin-arginine translocase subunit TatC [Herpetosiphonaceae bacterium]|nr:twin-arginine translocase subunit TatC [Herpetosiphonaceae bacterium]